MTLEEALEFCDLAGLARETLLMMERRLDAAHSLHGDELYCRVSLDIDDARRSILSASDLIQQQILDGGFGEPEFEVLERD